MFSQRYTTSSNDALAAISPLSDSARSSSQWLRRAGIALTTAVVVGSAAYVAHRKGLLPRLFSLSPEEAEAERQAAQAELVVRVMRETSRRFYHFARDVSLMAKELRAKLAADGQPFDETQFKAELSHQCQANEVLKKIRADVIAEFNVTEDTEAFVTDERVGEIRVHAAGVQQMLTDALNGNEPTLPGAKIPEELTDKRLLKVHRDINALKVQKAKQFAAHTGSERRFAKNELSQAIAMMSKAAADEFFESNQELLGKGGEFYYMAMNKYKRSNAFVNKLAQVDFSHKQDMIVAFS
eukprot:TRINITY_DN124462_c0_g1_i1.p1 TRINITY_DN124462_c0_g1~~TRINITY_DN124462_c0_g1_i1.p1  ORF type:complete len:297 (+),score=59.91 TRINITY_DN124462_c0_g1_i1:63-953(+)